MKSVISGLVLFCVATVAALLAGMAAGGLTPALAWGALALGTLAGGGAWFSLRDLSKAEPIRGWAAWGVITVFALFALRAFCWLVFTKDGDICYLSPNNAGDLPLHITFIRYLAHGVPLWPDNPIYSAGQLHYPFGVDLFNALLTLVHVDLFRGLIWVGLLGAFATGVMLWRWGGAFTMAGFLFNGGATGFLFFNTYQLMDYQSDVDWKSIPLALFITQRGLLYAIPTGLALLWSWRARLLRGERGLPLWIEVLLYATMPLFHLHTFMFLSAMLGCWLVVVPARNGISSRREIFRVGMLAFLPALALIWMLTGGFHCGKSIHFTWGWMTENEDPQDFWFQNFGFLPYAVLALLGWLWWRRKQPETLAIAAVALPAILFFRLAFLVMLAQWDWDNSKIMLWCYLAVLPAIWVMLRECRTWIRAVACCALFFSGAISLIGGLDGSHTGFVLADREELYQIDGSLHNIPATATFACNPTYNHPLLLVGRKVVAGYEGHLASHGIDYKERFALLERLLRGEPGWQDCARYLGADYLFWGELEQQKYGDAAPWKESVPIVAEGPWGTIYDLRNLKPSPKNTP